MVREETSRPVAGCLIEDQSCARCPRLVASRRRIVHGCGDLTAGVVFVGEAPGRHGADRTGVPFSGDKSGRTLRRILLALGLAETEDPADVAGLRCFVTNAVRCCPPGNRTPAPAEVAACAPYLARELDLLEPRLIVPVGRVALHAVGLRYLGHDPGAIRPLHATPIHAGARTIVPLVHPARISYAQVAAFIAAMRPLLSELV
ncbi:MAG TPA: uracil-DNA glycosylase [Roseiflexaceae bacterium]|nr:uracil-DNA glycosylase [Roseiflexaceae bacterium]